MLLTRAGQAQLQSAITPASYSGLKVWLEGNLSTFTHVTDVISQVSDASGSGNNANQATEINKPIRVTDSGVNVSQYDGTKALIVAPAAAIDGTTWTMVFAMDMVSLPLFNSIFMKRTASAGYEILAGVAAIGSGDVTATLKIAIDNATDCVIKSSGGQFGRHTFSIRCGGGNVITKWDGAGGSTTAVTPTTNSANMFIGGASGTPTTAFNGKILGYSWHDNDIGATAVANLEARLKAKFGTA